MLAAGLGWQQCPRHSPLARTSHPPFGMAGGVRGHGCMRVGSSERGRGLPFTRSSACSCNNCCCRISNCLCSSSNCRLMYSWRHGSKDQRKKREKVKETVFPKRKRLSGARGGHPDPSHPRAGTDPSARAPSNPARRAQEDHCSTRAS